MKTLALVILVSLALFSCRKEDNAVQSGNYNLVGTWINPQYNDTLVSYSKAHKLIINQIGFTFKSDQTLVAREINGWCGTPPVTTADYNGTWTRNDSIVNITVGFWGGTVHYVWKLISVNNQNLIISVVKEEYQSGK